MKTYLEILLLQNPCSKIPAPSKAILNHILKILRERAFSEPSQRNCTYMSLVTCIIEAVFCFDKENLLLIIALQNLQDRQNKILMRSAKVQRDDDESLLWNHFSADFESSSFLLSEELFEKVNALASGNLAGKLAHNAAADVAQRMETCLRDFLVVVTVKGESNGKLLVRTPQITVLCAITELLMMDSDFTLLLLGLKSFTNLIAAITESKPRRISQRDFDTLLIK